MDGAAKTAREQARAKSGQNAKKLEQAAPKQPMPETAPTEEQDTLFTTQQK